MKRFCALAAALALLAVGGCFSSPDDPGWNLVGAYDATTIMALDDVLGEELPPEYVWVPFPGMSESCGPPKAADGLGVFEAEAMANSLTPTLAIVLERTLRAPEGPLSTDGVRIALGRDRPEYLLQPAVMPRYIAVHIEGEGNVHHKQLVRTQLQMETCMEHKTGRGWIGGDASNLRQAFLLDPPDEENWGSDRRYFGGQRDPIPSLLGPPDACIVDEVAVSMGPGGAGEGSLDLVPSDVWGASLRSCEVEERPGAPLMRNAGTIPLRVSGQEDIPVRRMPAFWDQLTVVVNPYDTDLWKAANPEATDESVRVDVLWAEAGGARTNVLSQHPLFDRPEGGDGTGWAAGAGMTDLLARVPYYYPSVGPRDEPDQYVLLLVPNWQIVEGLRRIYGEAQDADRPRATGGAGVQYGVGWLLDNPQHLFVQVPDPRKVAEGEQVAEKAELEDDTWLDLTEIMGGGRFGLRTWGYTVGMLAGRKPIALPVDDVPIWDQTAVAQRAAHQSYFLGGLAVLVFFLLGGLRRMPDLWTRMPEERVDYWPGVPADDGKGAGDGQEAPEGGGGEGGGGGGGGGGSEAK